MFWLLKKYKRVCFTANTKYVLTVDKIYVFFLKEGVSNA